MRRMPVACTCHTLAVLPWNSCSCGFRRCASMNNRLIINGNWTVGLQHGEKTPKLVDASCTHIRNNCTVFKNNCQPYRWPAEFLVRHEYIRQCIALNGNTDNGGTATISDQQHHVRFIPLIHIRSLPRAGAVASHSFPYPMSAAAVDLRPDHGLRGCRGFSRDCAGRRYTKNLSGLRRIGRIVARVPSTSGKPQIARGG